MKGEFDFLRRGAPAMSCVESYLLAWLAASSFNIPLLYCESYITCEQAVIQAKAGFEYFNGFPRLQDTLQSAGILSQSVYISGEIKRGLTLAQTKPVFFDRQKLAPWRDDHYIRLTAQRGEHIYYLNCYPVNKGAINRNVQRDVLSGKRLNYKIISTDQAQLVFKSKTQLKNMAGYIPCRTQVDDLDHLRNTILILKISRRRISRWMLRLSTMDILQSQRINELCAQQNSLLDNMLALCERARLRKADNIRPLIEQFERLQLTDAAIADIIRDRNYGLE